MIAGEKVADRNAIRTLIIGNLLLLPTPATLYSLGTMPVVTAVVLMPLALSVALLPAKFVSRSLGGNRTR